MKPWMAAAVFVCGLPGISAAQKLGAPAAALETPYHTEHAWALREIVADINEIARYRTKQPAAPPFTETISPWHPELLTAYAAAQLGVVGKVNDAEPPDQYDNLLDLSPDSIIKAGAVVSAALTRDLRNPRAHEAAAFVLGAFGLREAAGGLSDVRWVMNRMTAHLAVAAALRGTATNISDDGKLARATLLVLSNRRRAAAEAIDVLVSAGKGPSFARWQRALRIRVTNDWRLLTDPARGSRLEKLEYFRARRFTIRRTRAGQELATLGEPVAADFTRIVLSYYLGVEDGNEFGVPAISGELAEIGDAHRLIYLQPLPDDLPAVVINARAGRLLSDGAPQVLPWGAWAESAQRHLGMAIGEIDRHLRRNLVMPDRADQWKALVDQRFAHLTLFPVAASARTVGTGAMADLRFLPRAVELSLKNPELVTFDFWEWLESAAQNEHVRGMQKARSWFAQPSAAVPYEAGRRLQNSIGAMPLPALEALVNEAPTDRNLLGRALGRRQDAALSKKVAALLQPRADYDLWAIELAVDATNDRAIWLPLLRKACTLAVSECPRYAQNLRSTDEAAAAAEYERAFNDPGFDSVLMSNSSSWLVSYYERNGQHAKALDLAQRSADVGSATGQYTLARYYERRGRIEEASELVERVARRYPLRAPWLTAFYYRQAVVAKRPEYQDRWTAAARLVFPNGLQQVPAAMPKQPASGVIVDRDSAQSRRVRLQAGDIIVGLDGFKVENAQQLLTVLSFSEPESMRKFTAWRGILFTVELPTEHGMALSDYPLKGVAY